MFNGKAVVQATVRPPLAPLAPTPPPVPVAGVDERAITRLNVDDPVLAAEYEAILSAFDELKQLGDAEMKVTTVVEKSGQVRIIWVGLIKKRSLENLKRVYRIHAPQSAPVGRGQRF